MALSVSYTHFDGELVYESRGGVERFYVPDALGSTVALTDAAGTTIDTFTYWPYGEVASRSGTTATPFTFLGLVGYFRDALDRLYVRARYYLPTYARWLTLDPLWPREGAYGYAGASPILLGDWTGLSTCMSALVDGLRKLGLKTPELLNLLSCVTGCLESSSYWVSTSTCLVECLVKAGIKGPEAKEVLYGYACCVSNSPGGLQDPCDTKYKHFDQNRCCKKYWCMCMYEQPLPVTPDKILVNAQICETQTWGHDGCECFHTPGEGM